MDMENYLKLDFDAADVTFALRRHHPEAGEHGQPHSSQQAKQEALSSPRLQRILEEARSPSRGRLNVSILCPATPGGGGDKQRVEGSAEGGSRAVGGDWSQDGTACSEDFSADTSVRSA